MKLIFLIFITSSFVMAQNRLNSFIEEVIMRNPSLKASENKYKAKEFSAVNKGVLPDPVFRFSQWIDPVETRVGPQQNIFSLSQKIPFPGKLSFSEEIVMEEAMQEKLHYLAAKRDLIYDIKLNWYDLYFIDRSLNILEDYHLLLQDFVNAASAKYATGQGIQAQVFKAQVEQATIQTRILDMQRKRYSIQVKLNQLRIMEPDKLIPVVSNLDTSFIQIPADEVLKQVVEMRSEYQVADHKIKQAQLAHSLVNKNWYPDFTIQANYITVANENSMAADAGKDAWGLMLAVNLPLWYSGRIAQIQDARLNVRMHQNRLSEVEQKLKSEIWDLQYSEKLTRQTIILYQDYLIPQAENSLKSALSAYRSGSLGFLELLDAERMLLQLRLNYLNEKVNYRKIIAGLDRATEGQISNYN
jgi:outer membrane protein TolC